MNATLQSHLDNFNEAEFNSHVEAFKAAPGQPASLGQLCQLWQKSRGIVTLASGVLIFVPKAGPAIQALISALDAVCTTPHSGIAAVNMQTVLQSVCNVWEPVSQFLPLVLHVPGVSSLPTVVTIINGLTAALNSICATLHPVPTPAAA